MESTVPALLAAAHGLNCQGPARCFYCGASCAEQNPVADFVRDSFTGRNDVRCPGSPWVCPGCVLCFREDCELTYHDGERRRVTKAAMRMHSWVVTRSMAVAATKAHLAWLRQTCLAPPEPPFAISLADSGQKHLLYRGVVNHSTEAVDVTLEGERCHYRPYALADRLRLCGQLIAATGKPALREPVTASFALAVLGRYAAGEALLAEWQQCRETPLSRLAHWLSPNKETCLDEYPSDLG